MLRSADDELKQRLKDNGMFIWCFRDITFTIMYDNWGYAEQPEVSYDSLEEAKAAAKLLLDKRDGKAVYSPAEIEPYEITPNGKGNANGQGN